MASQVNLEKFNDIYDKTYSDIMRYVIVKCHNINDANDIIQDVYFELWKILNKKEIVDTNIKSYLIGIAINKIKKHYSIVQRFKTISFFDKDSNDIELIDNIKSDIDIEDLVIKSDDWNSVWGYLKNKKNQDIPKVFYLYYKLGLSLKEISNELEKSESYIKNLIYRNLKELSSIYGGELND